MSLFGALFTGVSALSAQSQALNMVANNISNVSTIGYKRDEASFATLVTQETRATAYAPGGVNVHAKSTINQQGTFQQTNSSTDAAISGDGFFVVERGTTGTQTPLYTRAGSFTEDSAGYLKNEGGFFLMGWPLTTTGALPTNSADMSSLVPVDVALQSGVAQATQTVTADINLDATQAVSAVSQFSRAVTVYDSLGTAQVLTLDFNKTVTGAAGVDATWDVTVTAANGVPATTTATIPFLGTGAIDTATAAAPLAVTTNATTGVTTVTLPLALTWTNGSTAPQAINLDLSNVTQFSSAFDVPYINQDGAALGQRTGVSIDKNGFVVASFSNGQTRNLYQVPVAMFTNPNGLQAQSGNVYIQTQDSGSYNLRQAGTSGAGTISPSALEASNVDIADEFSKMIITQRAYSAGSKVISTADQMLQELMNIH